jgi:putative membrane-bound dehydrogenase-like protein
MRPKPSLLLFLAAFWLASRTFAADPAPAPANARDGNRLAWLDDNNPWRPDRNFPKLVTPQWVGEEDVECVVILAIDDMRDPAKYETFLRPILARLKRIDGRGPVSIMTCSVKPDDPQLAQWLAEGLSFEVHTIDHPCPLLQGGDLGKAKSTYDRCVDLMNEIPGNRPVAFRMPCCDSLNTLSPRFYAEIFNTTTPKGNSLAISSSVFNLFTPNDPDVPRDLVIDADGSDKFRKYLPKGLIREGKTFNTFVNWIEDYPYPYVVDRLCWEFPCVVPSDWSAQHLQKPNNPDTIRDLKAALDITVLKQGVYNFVFHPHNWIKPEQVVELIDHAVVTHGRKVKFLTFREALERLQKNVLNGGSLRDSRHGLCSTIVDVDNDGYQDVVWSAYDVAMSRLWSPAQRSWTRSPLPGIKALAPRGTLEKPILTMIHSDGAPSALLSLGKSGRGVHFDGHQWIPDLKLERLPMSPDLAPTNPGHFTAGNLGIRFRDLDRDGICEFLVADSKSSAAFQWSEAEGAWVKLPFSLPGGLNFATAARDAGLRFVDLDEDGYDDIVFSNSERFGVYLFQDMQAGWSRVVVEGTPSVAEASVRREPAGENKQPAESQQRGSAPPATPLRRKGIDRVSSTAGKTAGEFDLPAIVRDDGSDNGFFVHSRHLFWQNEDTDKLPDLVDRRSFNEILAQAPDLPAQPKSPEAALRSIRVRPGFTVELMAAEPLVLDPIAFAFGADGRLWVVEMGDYPLGVKEREVPQEKTPLRRGGKRTDTATATKDDSSPLLRGGGQIRCLEDTDGDGRYDKATIFLEVPYPTGVLPWRKGILVTAAPNIFYAEDTDGDGRADKREILYSGFVEGNQQHRVNGLVWGLDNWIYVANGDSGGEIVSRKTGRKVNANGRDLRIRPDTGELDTVAGQTQFGRSCDDWGNWFGCNNSNPMYQYVLDDVMQRRNSHYAATVSRIDVPEVAGNAPVFPISLLLARFNDLHTANRFTSACSAMIYRDELFGRHFAGNAFVCEPVHNLVHREIVSPKGVTFTSRRAADEQESEFLASSDNWFRPTTVKAGPDGALWIADMYRHVIEHPQWIPDTWQKKLDLRAGHDKGRLYRVYPVDQKPRAIPRLDRLDTAGLVAALDSPSGWQRDVAQQLLIERQDKAAIALLEAQTLRCKRPQARLHALCTLEGLGELEGRSNILIGALSDEHPGVRRHAVRLGGKALAHSAEGVARLLERQKDADPHVRLQLAYALGDLPAGDARNVDVGLAIGNMLVAEGHDRFLLSALVSSIDKTNIEKVLSTAVTASGKGRPDQNLIGLLLDLSAALGNDDALANLVQYVTRPQDDKFADWQFTAFGRLLDSLARRSESLAIKIRRLKGGDAENLIAAVDRLFTAARALVADRDAGLSARMAALPLLGRGREGLETDLELLASLLSPQAPAELQEAAVLALGRLPRDRVPELLLAHWRGYGAARRAQVLQILMSRDAWAAELVAALAADRVARTDFDAARRQRLLEHRSIDVRQKAAAAFAASVNVDRQKVIEEYQTALATTGDLERGAKLFASHCAQCHKLAGAGYDVGPDLASLTDKSPEAMLVAVLDPNRAVEDKFVAYVAETKAGMIHTGILAAETGNSITLRGPEGKEQVILRADLEELVSTSKSTMPEGLEKDLAPQDLADIIAHVRSNVPLPRRKAFPGNEPRPVKPDADGTLALTAANCEIYGSTLIFESQYGNLGYWSSLDDHAVWTINGARGGKYAVEFEWACDSSVAGNPWLLESGAESLAGKVDSTGNWDTYRKKIVGELTLAAGGHRLTLRPGKKPQGALIDLTTVRLILIR